MRGLGRERVGRILIISLLVVGLSGALAFADSDCWCAQYVDLRSDIPTRGSNVFLRLLASAALTGAALWSVDTFNPPNPDWYRTGALLMGAENVGSALTDLLLPTERSIERSEDRIADSTLSESLCRDTLRTYSGRTQTHRFLSGGIGIASGLAQLFLLGPGGQYATGDVYDYVFLVTGGLDIVGGVLKVLFSTPFERAVREAREDCG